MFNGIFGYILGGLVIGVLARLVKPGADSMSWIMTIVLGIVGAVIGGYVSGMLGVTGILVWVIAILAAVVLLFIYEAARKK